jgi:VanZ family protein
VLSFSRWRLPALVALILAATLAPLGNQPPRFDGGVDLADVVVNIALFFPLGLLLGRTGHRWAAAAGWSLLLSTSVELIQGSVVPGRRGSPADIAANVSGALAGALWQRTPGFIVAMPVLAWPGFGAALHPAPSRTRQWWGQWSHRFAGTEPFHGTILDVRFAGHPVPNGRLASTAALVDTAEASGLALEVTLRSGGTSEGLTHLAGISDGQGHTIIAIEQAGNDLLLSWRSRGAGLGLRSPRITFAGALRAPRGERLEIRATVKGGSATIRVLAESASYTAAQQLTMLAGWRNFIPSGRLGPAAARWLDAAWTLGFLAYLLLAFSAIRARRLS